MRPRLAPQYGSAIAIAAIVSLFAFVTSVVAQPTPGAPLDFSITITSQPSPLNDEIDQLRVEVSAGGDTHIKAFRLGRTSAVRNAMELDLSQAALNDIYSHVVAAGFFDLNSEFVNYSVADGDRATFTVTANGRTHSVTTVNKPLPAVDAIAHALNSYLPQSHRIYYNALIYPGVYDNVPGAPQ